MCNPKKFQFYPEQIDWIPPRSFFTSVTQEVLYTLILVDDKTIIHLLPPPPKKVQKRYASLNLYTVAQTPLFLQASGHIHNRVLVTNPEESTLRSTAPIKAISNFLKLVCDIFYHSFKCLNKWTSPSEIKTYSKGHTKLDNV